MSREVEILLRQLGTVTPGPDPLLQQIADICDEEAGGFFQTGLVLSLGGILVRGVPTSQVEMRRALDNSMEFFMRVQRKLSELDSETYDPRAWDDIESEARDWFTKPYRESKRKDAETHSELQQRGIQLKDIADIPDDLVAPVLQAFRQPRSMTMSQAQVRLPSGEWEDVGVLRVSLLQVGAWWTFELSAPPEVADEVAALRP